MRCDFAVAEYLPESKSRRAAKPIKDKANPVAKEVFPVGLRFLQGRFHPARFYFYTPSF
ncbi:hypothetical protein [Azospirillum melinis]